MVGIFSRFSAGRSSHRRSKSAAESRETSDPTVEVGGSSSTGNDHDEIDATVEFKPIDHPTEPLNYDQPVRCPIPDPSILNDGRLWKERISTSQIAGTSAGTALPIEKQASHAGSDECEASGIAITPHPASSPKHVLLGSVVDALHQHRFRTLVEPSDAAGNQTAES